MQLHVSGGFLKGQVYGIYICDRHRFSVIGSGKKVYFYLQPFSL